MGWHDKVSVPSYPKRHQPLPNSCLAGTMRQSQKDTTKHPTHHQASPD